MKILALIDGEHYLPVLKAALSELAAQYNSEVCAGVFLGGWEKLKNLDSLRELQIPVVLNEDRLAGIQEAVQQYAPDLVFDLSDEPVVNYQDRFIIANIILSLGVPYAGPDFRFEPPEFLPLMEKPSLTIAGTGKRIGKTAFGGYIGRVLSAQGGGASKNYDPVIVTMGRGGPPAPELIPGNLIKITPNYLLREYQAGKHAASDHYEDALTSRLPTIGCRRCGGGFTGKVFTSVVRDGAQLANSLSQQFVIFEGSGASLPPVRTDAWIVIIGAHQPLEHITRYMAPYRLKKADLICLTMAEPPLINPEKMLALTDAIFAINPTVPVIPTIFRPLPLGDLANKKILWCTTSPHLMNKRLISYLEQNYQCRVMQVCNDLSRRPLLQHELARVNHHVDAVLVELKAAAVDVVTAWAIERGLEVIYQDNAPQAVSPEDDLAGHITDSAELAIRRFNSR